ncbi:MAG: DnaJ C-terminal domain-containing protein [Myxococcota bacterium]
MAAHRKDAYATLGVSRDADDDTIRKTYRKLARELHPDVNPNNAKAEDRFKAVSEAYAVLSDADKRRDYDEFGDVAFQSGFDAKQARRARSAYGGGFQEYEFGGIDDLFSDLFGRGAGRRGARSPLRQPGATLEATLELDFLDAARGGEQRFQISRPTASGANRSESVSVRIPPGVADGGKIRLRGKGGEGIAGGPPGDLVATIRIRPHSHFKREGRDVFLEVPISIAEATLGAKVEVPTLDGRVTVTIPPGTDSGAKLRLKGKGFSHPSGGALGDFFVVAKICVPKDLTEGEQARFEELRSLDPADLRGELDAIE